jgi:hypothetical protein
MGGSSSLFAARLAPVQAVAQGYVGTIGTRQHDYIIGDRVVCPAESMRNHHTEKVAYLGFSGAQETTCLIIVFFFFFFTLTFNFFLKKQPQRRPDVRIRCWWAVARRAPRTTVFPQPPPVR